MFKPTYLYVKTHNKTGLKYFGKTTNKDPYKYKGSGVRWNRHLQKHGIDISTEIVGYYVDEQKCKEIALKFSKENNIVESKDWANLKEETLDGGWDYINSNGLNLDENLSPESLQKRHVTRKKNGLYAKENNSGYFGLSKLQILEKAKKQKETLNDETWKNTKGQEKIRKHREKKNSEEWKDSIGKNQKENHRKTINDPLWKATTLEEAKKKQKETKSSKEWKQTKGIEHSRKISETKSSEEWKQTVGKVSIEKQKETKNSEEWRKEKGKQQSQKISQTKKSEEWKILHWKVCENCGIYCAPGNYKQWHGDKCKQKK